MIFQPLQKVVKVRDDEGDLSDGHHCVENNASHDTSRVGSALNW